MANDQELRRKEPKPVDGTVVALFSSMCSTKLSMITALAAPIKRATYVRVSLKNTYVSDTSG